MIDSVEEGMGSCLKWTEIRPGRLPSASPEFESSGLRAKFDSKFLGLRSESFCHTGSMWRDSGLETEAGRVHAHAHRHWANFHSWGQPCFCACTGLSVGQWACGWRQQPTSGWDTRPAASEDGNGRSRYRGPALIAT